MLRTRPPELDLLLIRIAVTEGAGSCHEEQLYGGVTRFASLIVTPPAPTGAQLTSLTISPDIIVGGQPAQGTVTIASAVGTATTVGKYPIL